MRFSVLHGAAWPNYSRRIIGWSLGATKDARLTLAAFNRAVFHRRPRAGVIFPTATAGSRMRRTPSASGSPPSVVQSMNRPSEITEHAHMESFFHSMKSDVVHGTRFRGQHRAGELLRSYIPYYNGVRLHSGIGYSSPAAWFKLD